MADTDRFIVAFPAELKQISSKKTASLDVEHRIVLATADGVVTALSQLDFNTPLKVTVEIDE